MTAQTLGEMMDRLAARFPSEEVKTRPSGGGDVFYLERQSYENRLDEVVGGGSWQNKYEFGPNDEIVCYIGIRIGDEWVWKADGAGQTNIEEIKGGLTDSFKRACVRWGIARYLYDGKGNEKPQQSKTKEPAWQPSQLKTVKDNTYIETTKAATNFLNDSGLRFDATAGVVKTFALCFQGKKDEDMSTEEAYEFAKLNWSK